MQRFISALVFAATTILTTTAAPLAVHHYVPPKLVAREGVVVSNNTSLENGSIFVRHVKRQCVPNEAFYDDGSTLFPIEYRGAWTHLSNQGDRVNSGTLSYTSEANAMVILPDPFPAGTTVYADITVWSTSKNDRGQFNIYIGETLIGTGDQYSSSAEESSTQMVYFQKDVPIPGGSYFVVKNDKGAQFMAFDAFEVAYCN